MPELDPHTFDPDDYFPALFKLESLHTDPTPYKIYMPELTPKEALYIRVLIPIEEVISTDPLVLTPSGLAYAMTKLSRAIRKVYQGEDVS